MAAPVTAHQRTAELSGQLPDALAPGGDGGNGTEQSRGGGCGVLPDAVPCRHVADLVTQHAGEFLLTVHVGDDAAGDVDVSPGQRKSVDFGAVEHREMVFQIAAVAVRGEIRPEPVDHCGQFRVRVLLVLLHHLAAVLLAQIDFLILAHENEVLLPRDRVRGTTLEQGDGKHTQKGGKA